MSPVVHAQKVGSLVCGHDAPIVRVHFAPTSFKSVTGHFAAPLIGYNGVMRTEPRKYRTNFWLAAAAWLSVFLLLTFSFDALGYKGLPCETVAKAIGNLI